MAHDVFISYASSDKAVADAVCAQLESIHRIRCWIAPRDVTPGASWAESIIEALDGSKIMVLIFSSSANASMQIEREVERAVHKGINIIPLRIENTVPTKTLEYFISAPHWLDALSVPLEHHIAKLATSVNALLARQAPPRLGEGVAAPAAARVPVVAAPDTTSAGVAVPVKSDGQRTTTGTAAKPRSLASVMAVILVLVAVAVVAVFAVQRLSAPPAADLDAEHAARSAPVPAATTEMPTPPAALPPAGVAAPASNAAAATTPSTASPDRPAGDATASTSTTAARGSARGAVRGGNLLIELDNNLPDGSIKLEVDGAQRFVQKLEDNAKVGSLTLAKGAHEVRVTLFTPAGAVKETKTTKFDSDPAVVRTLKVRLSRFRRNLELETVVPKLDARATPPSASATKEAAKGTAEKPAAVKPPAAKP